MRLLGIDYGLRRTGLALGDTESRLALPFEVFEGLPDPQLAQAIGRLVRREAIDVIVIGLPLNADGSVSGQSKLTERFIVTLQQVVGAGGEGAGPPIHRTSEYLTTHDVESRLAGHYTRGQKRARVDALAAARILQDWLDSQPPANS
jgi:putative holliday junction resolvase